MIKKIVTISIVLLVFTVGCGKSGKYADAKAVMNDMIKVQETFKADLEGAKDGKAVAAAITKFANSFKGIMPKAKELDKKYPELKKKDQLPPEMKELAEKSEKISQEMNKVMMKKMKEFASDKDVQKASKEMTQILMSSMSDK